MPPNIRYSMDINRIIELRLKLNDPKGVHTIVDGSVPVNPLEDVAYRVSESRYYNCDNELLQILISDATYDSLLSSNTELKAQIKALDIIIMKLSDEILESQTSGAENIKFTSLSSRITLYKTMRENLSNKKPSFFAGQTSQPTVAGGNL